ncbi:MAG: sulfotransferase domain-containing protein [Bacteroidota bacterium]
MLTRTAKRTIKEGLMLPRRLTSARRVLPDFLLIGAQKAGTTSLYHYLTQHPRVLPVHRKEVHYFDIGYRRGLGWYRSFFPTAREVQREAALTGEASPYYLFHPQVPARIRQDLPDAKLIVLMRNPVDRAYSHYHHEVRKGYETLPFEEAVDREEERIAEETARLGADPAYYSQAHRSFSYLARGRYLEQLRPWIDRFGREQMLLLPGERMYADPQGVLDAVCGFLGIEPFGGFRFRKHNDFRYDPLDPALRARLAAYFRPHNEALYDALGEDYGWEREAAAG